MTTQDGSATTAPSVEKNYEERKTNSKNCCSGFTGHFVGGFCIVLFMVVVDCDSLVVAGRCLRYCAYRRAVMGVDGIGVWTMTPEERQALREKHQPTGSGWGDCTCGAMCEQVGKDEWAPCDVIKVLDALEFTDRLVSPAQTDTCDHKKRNICLCDWGDDCAMNSEPDFTYCPKCGEKL